MKFFAVLILPKDIDLNTEKSVEHATSALMRPFKMWEDDVPVENGRWDYYWCCTKEWMNESHLDYSAYPSASNEQAPIVFPVDQLTSEGVPYSIITPEGEWHRSKATYVDADPSWELEALNICRSFPGSFGVLLYCHG